LYSTLCVLNLIINFFRQAILTYNRVLLDEQNVDLILQFVFDKNFLKLLLILIHTSHAPNRHEELIKFSYFQYTYDEATNLSF